MTLPTIRPPAGTPAFLADGLTISEDSVYASVGMASGHSRQRRRWTVTERVVPVAWLLREQRLADVDRWFNETLEAGTLPFAAPIANQGLGPRRLWWRATWISYQVEMLVGTARGRVTGSLLLVGDGYEVGPA